jgi:hypothetical protein
MGNPSTRDVAVRGNVAAALRCRAEFQVISEGPKVRLKNSIALALPVHREVAQTLQLAEKSVWHRGSEL